MARWIHWAMAWLLVILGRLSRNWKRRLRSLL